MRNRSSMFFYPKMRNRSGMFFSNPVIAHLRFPNQKSLKLFSPNRFLYSTLSLHVVGVTGFVLTLYRFGNTSSMTLYRFGNTSSSSLWYELAYSEAKGRIKSGDRACQIAFESGFKCNSAVWKAIRTLNPAKEKSPWMDEIHRFMVDVPKVSAFRSSSI